jgi:hypothetical protein
MDKQKAIKFIKEMTTEVKPKGDSLGQQALAGLKTFGKATGLKTVSVTSSLVGTAKDVVISAGIGIVAAPEILRASSKKTRNNMENLAAEGQALAITEALELKDSVSKLTDKVKSGVETVSGKISRKHEAAAEA